MVEEEVRENDFTETDVGKLFLRMRDRRKVRERTDDLESCDNEFMRVPECLSV